MKYINVIDAKEEVYLTLGGKPIIKMTPVTENLPRVEEKNKNFTRHAHFDLFFWR